MPYNSAMTAVLKCNNCAKSDSTAAASTAAASTAAARAAAFKLHFNWLLSGGGGTGKSFVVTNVAYMCHYVPASRIRAVRLVHESNTQVQP